jgi:hypothetical protein
VLRRSGAGDSLCAVRESRTLSSIATAKEQFTSYSFHGAIFYLEFIRRSAHFAHLTFLFWEFPAMLLTVLLLAAVLALELRWIMR